MTSLKRSRKAKLITDENIGEAARHLADRDSDLSRLLIADGVPPLWSREPGFSTLIHIILEQQVSLPSGLAVFRRLENGIAPFSPEGFLSAGVETLRSFGVTRQKAQYCVNIAGAIQSNRLNPEAFFSKGDRAVYDILISIKGVGPWTANTYLLTALRRPDIWPPGDVALVKTVKAVKRLPADAVSSDVTDTAESWHPYRSVAARMIWHHYLSGGIT